MKKWINKSRWIVIIFNGEKFTIEYIKWCERTSSEPLPVDMLNLTHGRQWSMGDYRQIENDAQKDCFNDSLMAQDFMDSLPYPMYAFSHKAYIGNQGKHLVKIYP